MELREDPEAKGVGEARRSGHWLVRALKWVLEAVVGFAVFIAFFCVVALVVHLIRGDIGLRSVFIDGLRLFAGALAIAMLAFYVGRWVYWFADRWRSRPLK